MEIIEWKDDETFEKTSEDLFREGGKEGVKGLSPVVRGGYNGRGEGNTNYSHHKSEQSQINEKSFYKKHGYRKKSKREGIKEGGVYI